MARPRPHRFETLATAFAVWLSLAGTAAADELAASPDVTVELSGTPVFDRAVAHDDGSIATQDFGGLPDGSDVGAYHVEPGGGVLFAVDVTVALPGGLVLTPRDVARLEGGVYTISFDGAAAGIPDGVRVDAVGRTSTGDLLLSFDTTVDVGGVVDDEDLVSYDGLVFAAVLDGSALGLDPALDLDAVSDLGGGSYAISLDGSGSLGGVVFDDEDVLRVDPGGPLVAMLFDASAQHAEWSAADVDAVWVPEPGRLVGLAAGGGFLALLSRRRERRPRGRSRRPRPRGTARPAAARAPEPATKEARMRYKARILSSLCVLPALLAPVSARAVDGVIEINQTRALTGGVTSVDGPGFPVTVGSGSYRLTGDLVVANENETAIEVVDSYTTIDLNGFRIMGPNRCFGPPSEVVCTAPGSGIGIYADDPLAHFTTVKNGVVTGMGSHGIDLNQGSHVEGLLVQSNGGDGVRMEARGLVVDTRILDQGGTGLRALAFPVHFRATTIAGTGGVPSFVDATEMGGNHCFDGLCSAVPKRRFYLSQNGSAATDAPTTCDPGFHFATLSEMVQPASLQYDVTRGRTRADSGMGAPASIFGWVRTGGDASSSNLLGDGNCEAWSTNSGASRGTLVFIKHDWEISAVDPRWIWYSDIGQCSAVAPVWCVQD